MKELTEGVIRDWVYETTGWWTTRQMDGDLDIGSPAGKLTRRVAIHRLVTAGKIEKHPHDEGRYRYIRWEVHKLDPHADPKAVLGITWPHSIEDNTDFGLDKAWIYPKSVIIVAGVSNQGKTTFCLNFLIENMDKYHCLYMTNELSDEEFVNRMSNFTWVEVRDAKGNWKFDAVEHFENYQDLIQPDAINIIDYLDPGENPYYVGVLIDQIRQKLNKGIALIAIQKRVNTWEDKQGKKHYSYAEYGTGGQYSEHRARLVLHIDPTDDHRYLLTIKKSKMYTLNGRKFKFDIVQGGSQFHLIEEIKE